MECKIEKFDIWPAFMISAAVGPESFVKANIREVLKNKKWLNQLKSLITQNEMVLRKTQ